MDTPPTTTQPTAILPDDQDPAILRPHHGSGSVGPFFAVLSVILVLSVLSCIFGRFCASRAQGPDSSYDCLGWVRRRCRRGRCTLGCGVNREVREAAAVDLDPKIKENKQFSLPSSQP